MKKPLVFLALLAALAGCSSGSPPPVKPDFAAPAKTNLDVLAITVVDRSGMQPASSPYNTNNFRPTIANAIRQWVTDKLAATGSTGEAIVIIKDATLSAQALPYTKDWFTRQQASKYMAHAEVEIDVTGREGRALATASASRFETLPEKPTEVEKRNAYYTVLNGLMEDMSANLDASIQDHLGDFVITAPLLDRDGDTAPKASLSVPEQ